MIEFAPEEYWIDLNWYDAKVYCFALNIDGKTGWRLPTVEEFAEWIEHSEYAGIQDFKVSDLILKINFCWTSTEDPDYPNTVKVHCACGIINSTEGKEYIRLTKPCRTIA